MTAAKRILLVALALATLVGCTGGGSREGGVSSRRSGR
jgi:hypothetical protein